MIDNNIHKLAHMLFDLGLKHDPEGYGYINFPEDGRAPRYGKHMEDALKTIDKFLSRHFGENKDKKDNNEVPIIVVAIGIGGQATCVVPALNFVVKDRNREFFVFDLLGINYKSMEERWLSSLKENPETKLLWVVGSKSGTTDEPMINFQMTMRTMIRVWSRFRYNDEKGIELAEKLIEKLFDTKPLFEKTLNALDLSPEESEILRIIYSNLIIATGRWNEKENNGSRLDHFMRKSFANELFEKDEDKILSTEIAANLGGRFQGLSGNSMIYNALLGLDRRKMLEAAKTIAEKERKGDDDSEQIANDLWEREINHLLIVVPDDIVFNRFSEALGQIFPESTGKGRRNNYPFGIMTYCYDYSNLSKGFANFKKNNKAYFVITVKDRAALEISNEIRSENSLFDYELPDVNEEELAKLIQFFENIAVRYGLLNTAKVLIHNNNGVDIFNEEAVKEIMKGVRFNKEGDQFNRLRELFDDISPFRQPDVEYAKQMVREIGPNLYNPEEKFEDELPVRNQDLREERFTLINSLVADGPTIDSSSYGLKDNNGNYVTGDPAKLLISENIARIKTPEHSRHRSELKLLIEELNILQKLISKSGYPVDDFAHMEELKNKRNSAFHRIAEMADQIELSVDEDETAKQLAALMHKAHSADKSMNFVIYKYRGIALEILKKYGEHLGIDRIDFGSTEQHKSFQLSAGGVDVSMIILVQSVETLEEIRNTEDIAVNDGCVMPYFHGLYACEARDLYLTAYSHRFKEPEVETECAVMMTPDPAVLDNLISLMLVFSRMINYYRQLS